LRILINLYYIILKKAGKLFINIKKYLNTNLYYKNILVQGGGTFFAQLFGVISLPLITRLYEPLSFGYLTQFNNLISFLTILVSFRYEYFVLVPKKLESSLEFFVEILKFSFLLTLLLTFITFILLSLNLNYFTSFNLTYITLLGPLTAYLASISIAALQINQKLELYVTSAFAEPINKIFFFISAVLFYAISNNFYGLIFATTIGSLLKTIYLFSSSSVFGKLNKSNYKLTKFENIRGFKKSALSFSVSNLIQTLNGFLPIIFITKTYGSYTLGQWGLAISAVYLPTSLIGGAIGQVYFQNANKLQGEGISIQNIWIKTVKSLFYIAIPSYFLLALLAPILFPIVFGEKWNFTGIYTSILCISVGMSFISTPVDRTCYIVKKDSYPYLINILRLIFTALSILFSLIFNFTFLEYLILNSILASLLYLYDLYKSYLFSKLSF
jgi:O-antigen/teichoic acid export membrane protein